jgi:hypothetical protein
MTTATIKSNDTAIIFTSTLTKNDVAIDLTGASVLMLLRKGSTSYSLAATIVSAAAGTVSYTPGTGFPTEAGKYSQEWEITFSGGTKLTCPSGEYNKVIIADDLN